ncbi:hypothetical protein [Nocardioides sp.]|uniref:hypothetical protein n=1 Tax=Nocardioides sp. TaxID=35761 RepID=UPI0027345829|nr:hypothetical protein [Nocardioides sp.]MDP3890372.1 hypothetical protein [Nocardioides sp.]
MAHESGGGGGGGSLIDQLEPVFDEIISLIGELAGNEAAWSLFDSEDARQLQDGWGRQPGYFTIPGTYGFDTPALYVGMAPSHPDFFDSEVSNAQREQILQDAITQVWHDAHDSWTSSAVSTVYRSVSRNVWEPDPGKMTPAVSKLGYLTRWLNGQLEPTAGWASPEDPNAPAWLADLQQHWPATSESPQSFYAFWNDVNDKCSLYLHAAARLASTSAQVTATLSDFQTNLLEAAKRTRDRAKEALQQWQVWKDDNGAWPTGAMEDNSTEKAILGGVSYAAGVISLSPPTAVVAGPVSVAAGTLSYIFPAQSVVMESLQAATASEIHRGFINDLSEIEANLQKALDAVHTNPPESDLSTTGSEGFQAYAATVTGNRRDWAPPDVIL